MVLVGAVFNARLTAVDELNMREGEVANFAVELPLPQAVDGHLRHLHDVAHLKTQGRFVVGVGDPALLHAGVGRKGSLDICRFGFDSILIGVYGGAVAL